MLLHGFFFVLIFVTPGLFSDFYRNFAPNRSRDTLVGEVQQKVNTPLLYRYMAQAKYEIRRKCPICGAVFQIRTIDAVYCSKQCSDVAYKRKKDREAKEAK